MILFRLVCDPLEIEIGCSTLNVDWWWIGFECLKAIIKYEPIGTKFKNEIRKTNKNKTSVFEVQVDICMAKLKF